MALVAYENSDSSDVEDDENTNVVVLNKHVEEPSSSKPLQNGSPDPELQNQLSLFKQLPQPSTKKPLVIEEDDEFLRKKVTSADVVKPRAKIMVPSLSDFKDIEDRPSTKPKVTNEKKSGLLSMLPQPRNAVKSTTKSLIPQVVSHKTTTVKKKVPLPSPGKKMKSDSKALVTNYSDESDEGEVETDFFSMNKPIEELPIDDGLMDIDEPKAETVKKPFSIESYFKQDVPVKEDAVANVVDSTEYYGGESSSHSNVEQDASSTSNGDVLDEEAIIKLCGMRGKRKREEIQIVDVNQQEFLAEARQLLMKDLMNDTTARVSSSKKKGNEPTSQQRRKHQITYLAHQAKANEAELQNQWAQNRMSRRQTQSKYGF